jgi:phage antirepressor YoqD-like protein
MDRITATKQSRRNASYSVATKLDAIAAVEGGMSRRKVAVLFKVDEKRVRSWLKQKSQLLMVKKKQVAKRVSILFSGGLFLR